MGNFNEIAIGDICKMHEAVGMEFVIENGEIISAYIPKRRIRSERMAKKFSGWKVLK